MSRKEEHVKFMKSMKRVPFAIPRKSTLKYLGILIEELFDTICATSPVSLPDSPFFCRLTPFQQIERLFDFYHKLVTYEGKKPLMATYNDHETILVLLDFHLVLIRVEIRFQKELKKKRTENPNFLEPCVQFRTYQENLIKIYSEYDERVLQRSFLKTRKKLQTAISRKNESVSRSWKIIFDSPGIISAEDEDSLTLPQLNRAFPHMRAHLEKTTKKLGKEGLMNLKGEITEKEADLMISEGYFAKWAKIQIPGIKNVMKRLGIRIPNELRAMNRKKDENGKDGYVTKWRLLLAKYHREVQKEEYAEDDSHSDSVVFRPGTPNVSQYQSYWKIFQKDHGLHNYGLDEDIGYLKDMTIWEICTMRIYESIFLHDPAKAEFSEQRITRVVSGYRAVFCRHFENSDEDLMNIELTSPKLELERNRMRVLEYLLEYEQKKYERNFDLKRFKLKTILLDKVAKNAFKSFRKDLLTNNVSEFISGSQFPAITQQLHELVQSLLSQVILPLEEDPVFWYNILLPQQKEANGLSYSYFISSFWERFMRGSIFDNYKHPAEVRKKLGREVYCGVCKRTVGEVDESGKKIKKLQKCGVCGVLFYCSRECQKKDWIGHKKECMKLKVQMEKFESGKGFSLNRPYIGKLWVDSVN